MNAVDLDHIERLANAATPGPWEVGGRWLIAGVLPEHFGEGKCAWCKAYGEPVWVGKRNINGRRMLAHHHYDGHPNADDYHVIVAGPDVTVAGNYDYEAGGIIERPDAEFIAAARSIVPALVAEVRAYQPATKGRYQLHIHDCGHVEWWHEPDQGPINEQGCDACESAPYPGGWQPVYVRKAARP